LKSGHAVFHAAAYKIGGRKIRKTTAIQQELVDKERELIMTLRKKGAITEEVVRKIEYELDLEETRLILEKGLT
jgi:hypothetical protein